MKILEYVGSFSTTESKLVFLMQLKKTQSGMTVVLWGIFNRFKPNVKMKIPYYGIASSLMVCIEDA